jgi:hypothetical protein
MKYQRLTFALFIMIGLYGQAQYMSVSPGYLFTTTEITSGDSTIFRSNANNISLGARGEKRALNGHLGIFAGVNFQYFSSKVNIVGSENIVRISAITPHVRLKGYLQEDEGPFLFAGTQLFLVPFNNNPNVDLRSARFECGAGILFENGMSVNISAANSFIKSISNDNSIGKSLFFGIDMDIRIGEM